MEIAVFYRDMAAGAWPEKVAWCEENLQPDNGERQWYLRYPWIEFFDKDDYVMFKLRWG
jgi:hypothetical protein